MNSSIHSNTYQVFIERLLYAWIWDNKMSKTSSLCSRNFYFSRHMHFPRNLQSRQKYSSYIMCILGVHGYIFVLLTELGISSEYRLKPPRVNYFPKKEYFQNFYQVLVVIKTSKTYFITSRDSVFRDRVWVE